MLLNPPFKSVFEDGKYFFLPVVWMDVTMDVERDV